MTVVNVVIASQVTYRGVTYMEKDQFCGESCHVMKPQFTANRRSVHRNVECVDCHIVPGAAGFAEAKASGVRQLLEVTLNNYPGPFLRRFRRTGWYRLPKPASSATPGQSTAARHW